MKCLSGSTSSWKPSLTPRLDRNPGLSSTPSHGVHMFVLPASQQLQEARTALQTQQTQSQTRCNAKGGSFMQLDLILGALEVSITEPVALGHIH